jgi:hypothetical protein
MAAVVAATAVEVAVAVEAEGDTAAAEVADVVEAKAVVAAEDAAVDGIGSHSCCFAVFNEGDAGCKSHVLARTCSRCGRGRDSLQSALLFPATSALLFTNIQNCQSTRS